MRDLEAAHCRDLDALRAEVAAARIANAAQCAESAAAQVAMARLQSELETECVCFLTLTHAKHLLDCF
jgi:hypothetical protein